MAQLHRRGFLGSSLAALGSITISHTKSSGRVLGANERICIGVAGLNGRGGSHVGAYLGMKDVAITHLIDPDSRTFRKRAPGIEAKSGTKPQLFSDIRKALEDKNLDAVSIATPNHWHSLMTIWACQAGKDVYVEKPASHNVREGRVAVETARKYNRIVQHGTQSRADKKWATLLELTKSGKLGKLLLSYGLCYKPRNSIGVKPVAQPPAEVDFGIWLGPAKEQPFHANLVHYNWHWFWDFGNGDIGNQGVHQMDIARWMIPGATMPNSCISWGGRFGYEDQGQTPNTQVALYTFPGIETKMIFEVRGLKTDGFHDQKVGNVLVYEAGVVSGNGRFYPKGKSQAEALPKIDTPPRGPGDNFSNFIHTVRTRKRDEQHADILEGHLSSACCHFPMISYRLGEPLPYEKGVKGVKDDHAAESIERMGRHLTENKVPLDKTSLRCGRLLKIDPKSETILDDADADKMLTRDYREPFDYSKRA